MNMFRWYVQRFSDENLWFVGDGHLKNGNMSGVMVTENLMKPRARPKSKRISVSQHPSMVRLWTMVPENEVPEKVKYAVPLERSCATDDEEHSPPKAK